MKGFIAEVMRRFQGTDTQFALVQFSSYEVEHFDFNDFRRRRHPDPAWLLAGVTQSGGLTFTASAIKRVLERLFRAERGARGGASKVLIVVTDGKKYGDKLEYRDVIPLADSMAVTRYAIGVRGRTHVSTP
ncbi:PREDICTED: integrin alpha-X-like, partial [Lepidothrix coronata]|uniref:Integrin alpha-X-like n=1 Tax=Lepidothrix coronata TaxID=321398 RepID=A0A6J0JBB9_9PASS